MSELSSLIHSKREEVVQRFADRLYATAVAPALDREDVIDSLREFLGEVVRGLQIEENRREETQAEQSATATAHGRQRFGLGFDMGMVIREYGSLRDILFLVIEESGKSFSAREMRVLSKYLIGGIADAATQYAKERDEQTLRQTSKHVGFLAHELRNPLASARMAFQLLRKKDGFPRGDRSVATVERGLSKLGTLIDQALIEVRLRGAPQLNLEAVRVEALVTDLIEESQVEADSKGIRLEARVDAGTVRADPRVLHSALSNLVRNAVKFTHNDGVVRIRAKQADHRVVFEVEDACGGLPTNTVEKLFDPFVQLGNDRSGFGLGLAIAKQAVDAHQGGLRVHNLEGRGCLFVMDLPLEGPKPL